MLKPVSAAGRAAALAGIEAERAGGVTAFPGQRLGGEQFADGVERADIAGRIRARGPADGRLVDHHHVFDLFVTAMAR